MLTDSSQYLLKQGKVRKCISRFLEREYNCVNHCVWSFRINESIAQLACAYVTGRPGWTAVSLFFRFLIRLLFLGASIARERFSIQFSTETHRTKFHPEVSRRVNAVTLLAENTSNFQSPSFHLEIGLFLPVLHSLLQLKAVSRAMVYALSDEMEGKT